MTLHHRTSIFDRQKSHIVVSLLILAPLLGKYLPFSLFIGPLGLDMERILIGVVFVCAGFLAIRDDRFNLTLPDIGILCLVSLLIASIAWSIHPESSFTAANDLIWYLWFYLSMIILLNTKREIETLTTHLVYVGAFIMVFATLAYLTTDVTIYLFGLVSRNQLARDAVALFPIMFYAAKRWEYPRSFLPIGVMGLTMVIVPFSGSRGGLVGLIFVAISTVCFYAIVAEDVPILPLFFGLTLALLIAGAIFIIAMSYNLLPGRLMNIPLTPAEFNSPKVLGDARYHVYQYQMATIKEHWLTGIGYGSFQYVMETNYGADFRAHDLVSRVWLASGIGGVLILAAIFVTTVKNYIRAIFNLPQQENERMLFFMIAFFGMVLVGLTNIMVHEPLFYILLAVGAHYIPIAHNTSNE